MIGGQVQFTQNKPVFGKFYHKDITLDESTKIIQ